MTSLNLNYNIFTTLDPLSSLPQLTSLSLAGAQVSDTSALADLVNLTSLDAKQLQLTSIADLASLTKLTKLDLSFNTIADLTPISGLGALTDLNLASISLTSLSALAPLTKLVSVDVSSNQLTDVTVLGALPAVQSLTVSFNNDLTSLAPLVSSTYIGATTELFAEGLDCQALAQNFASLAAKSVTLHTSCN